MDYAQVTPVDAAAGDLDAILSEIVARQPFAGPSGLAQWCERLARRGDRVVYHVGDLATDCGGSKVPETDDQALARRYRDTAWALAAAGRIALTQVRLRSGVSLYCATRT